jgi:RimJ/RimL family protein N-acetyltransferase
MVFKPVENLSQALQVRKLRNSCRQYLTNNRNHIGILWQVIWYYRYYRGAKNTGKYRLYLGYDDQGRPIGYGALAKKAGELLATECVAVAYQGRGYGRWILQQLICIAAKENRDLVAEIWSTNERSIGLHEKAGFKLASVITKGGSELRKYSLAANALESNRYIYSNRSRVVA